MVLAEARGVEDERPDPSRALFRSRLCPLKVVRCKLMRVTSAARPRIAEVRSRKRDLQLRHRPGQAPSRAAEKRQLALTEARRRCTSVPAGPGCLAEPV